MPLMKELLDRRVARDFVGREEELRLLLEMLEPEGPLVVFLYGIAGSGKSTLLNVFAQQARASATVIRLDCRSIEPTAAGLLTELAAATGSTRGTPEEIATRLGKVGDRVIVTMDTYEVFRLMDPWLRQVFVPLLPDNVRIVLCGREAPVAGWLLAPGWNSLFRSIRLDGLDGRNSLEYLYRAGVREDDARYLANICHGQPLALSLAASMQVGERTIAVNAGVGQRLVEELSKIYVADIPDLQTRRALEAACVVRRVTVPLLAAMLPEASPQDAQERIRALPFVVPDRDGLQIHDAVREAIAQTLRAQNPQEYRSYRRAAYRVCMAELRTAAAPDFWRCTADLLYLLENPVIREAFFPSGAQEYSMEPPEGGDEQAVLDIIEQHETPLMAKVLRQWWNRAPETFCIARDRRGGVAGFYCAFDPSRYARLQSDDPVIRSWMEHTEQQRLPRQHRVVFFRRWLSAEHGEAPSPVQAACWIDLKRRYLEMRPHLRRVYMSVKDLQPYGAVAQRLGFQVLTDRDVHADGELYRSALLDMGPASVDGWLAKLVAAELGVEQDGLLDRAARELVLDGKRVGLTRLEFGVLEFLHSQAGQAVPRISLLEHVWDQTYDGGSNVVDVVIRALRKKLGDRASVIQTVQGVGYKLRPEA